jgi:pimeloyl-ACP methyl ester carboxylesterase
MTGNHPGLGLFAALTIGIALSAASCATKPQSIADKNAAFRDMNQATHDGVDANYTHKYIEAGGVRWHYVEAGDPAGPAVLMLHGLPESWYSWSKVLPLLDPSFHYIVPDMKGYGRSTSADMDYGWHHVGDQTLALLNALGIQKVYIVGHDWGALISSVMVADHPDRFLGYVRMEADLAYTPGQSLDKLYALKPQWKAFQDTPKAIAFLSDAQKVIDLVYQPRMKSKLAETDRDYFVFEFSRPGVAEAIANYFKIENWDLETAVTKVANNHFPFPVLQLQADGDPSQPTASFADASKFPGVRLEWIADANHFDNLDQPKQVADAINGFLGGAAAWKTGSNEQASPVADFRNYRYGEVLMVTQNFLKLKVKAFSTIGLNDCPAALWDRLDAKALAAETGAKLVKLNGPRYWVLDRIMGSGISTAGEKKSFGGIEMQFRASLDTWIWQGSIGDKFYTPNAVHRDTVYLYKAGLPVYELVSDKGEVYRMQSYSQIADTKLSMEDLAGLGGRLKLPAGWTYRVYVLDADSRLESNGLAYVINDELFDTYQLVTK